MSTEKPPQFKSTKEYRLFKADPTNRSIRKIKKITTSMKQWGFLPGHPIMCTANGVGMVIKDGQHRFEAAKSLGIPVYYVCHSTHADISIPEVNRATAGAWNPTDYIESFCNRGNTEYAKLRAFIAETGMPAQTSAALLSGLASGGRASDGLRDGKFKVRDYSHAVAVAGVINKAKEHVKFARNKYFVDAVSRILRVEECKPSVLVDKMDKFPALIKQGHDTSSFTLILEELYNHQSRNRLPIAFMAGEVMKGRNPAFRGKK